MQNKTFGGWRGQVVGAGAFVWALRNTRLVSLADSIEETTMLSLITGSLVIHSAFLRLSVILNKLTSLHLCPSLGFHCADESDRNWMSKPVWLNQHHVKLNKTCIPPMTISLLQVCSACENCCLLKEQSKSWHNNPEDVTRAILSLSLEVSKCLTESGVVEIKIFVCMCGCVLPI